MKRKSFQSILTILLSAGALGGIPCTAPLTYAAIEDRGTTWWSVEELLEFNQEVEAEKQAECGDDERCKMEFGFNMIEKGPKYSALNNLLEGQIWITSINPTTETIKVLFFDDDMMLRRMGIEEKMNLESLFIGWSENPHLQLYNYDESHLLNESEGHHVIYYETSDTNGYNWIPAWEEVELSAAGSQLINNKSGRINYSAFADIFNAQGSFDYSNCLNASDYEEGMECQMMISDDQWVSYFPPREQMIEQEITDDTPQENDPTDEQLGVITLIVNEEVNEQSEPNSPEITEEPPAELGQDTLDENLSPGIVPSTDNVEELSTNTSLVSSKSLHQIANASNPKTPETGKSMKQTANSTEQPWWPIVLAITSSISLIWWLLPTRSARIRRKYEKSKKNHEKLLTKSVKCDKMGTV